MRVRRGPVLAIVAVAAAVAFFFLSCERRTRTVPVGFQGEAARNRYLAAQRLLEAMGTPVRALDGVESLDVLPEPDVTLIIPINRARVFSEGRSQALLDWVRRGGHLVVVTWSLWDDEARIPDPILDPLGVQQFMWPSDEEVERREAEDPRVSVDERSMPAESSIAGRGDPLHVAFDPRFFLVLRDPETARWQVRDASGAHLITLEEGRGLVTVLTDDYFLVNGRIDEWDHAEFVWRVAHLAGRAREVWLMHSAWPPGVMALLWAHGRGVLLSVLLLVACWVWFASRRFGPLRPDAPPVRRRLMEHIEAAARFQLRHGAGEHLAAGVREVVRARVRERHPGWTGLAPAELHTRLARQAGLPATRIEQALAPLPEAGRDGFTRTIATLERIRRTL